MTTYNFSELSAFEFEVLCRDLLQEKLGLVLEMFDPGPDRGVDIRYFGDDQQKGPRIVVQCKRWSEDSFPKLLRHLQTDELPKIQKLAPKRYILVTSVRMTPDRKDKIVIALAPWIKSPEDVIGKQDINGLLSSFAEVEKRHIKLWLTSTEVLNALLNSDIRNRSEDALERARTQLRLWVPNPSFNRARDILETDHVCVISGAPGIGKTMLANVLLADYVAREFQQIVISDDIAEGDRAWSSDTRQVFVYDDFLGHVTYGELRLRKNEQSRLANFIERVRNRKNKRFILTTREYILSEAVQRYERLSDVDLTDLKCVVSLEDYTRFIRARILYNHLFFSSISKRLRNAFLPEKKYWLVIGHRNYNPRVIEQAVSLSGVDSLKSEEFVSHMFTTLENPTKVWERIYENLPNMARHVLLAIASFPSDVLLHDLQDVVKTLSPNEFDPSEFRRAIRMIEGTFINLWEAAPGSNDRQRVVALRDPSVRDYLWTRLEEVDGEAETLLERTVFFEQCEVLYEGRKHIKSMFPESPTRDVVDNASVASRAVELIDSPTSRVQKWMIDGALSTRRAPIILERRTAFLLEMLAADPKNQRLAKSTNEILTATIDAWENGRGSLVDSLEMLKRASQAKDSLGSGMLEKAQRTLLRLLTNREPDKEVFETVVGLSRLKPLLLSEHEFDLDSWRSEFEDFLDGEREWLLWSIDDADWLQQEIWDIEAVAAALGTDVSELEAAANDRIASLYPDLDPDDEDQLRDFYDDDNEESDVAQIDTLFESLEEITEDSVTEH